ncbi:DGQHR domain-containing protein DpdB [Mesorhizobium sp. M1D.F.Ca.ET.043.01.1.1]|uniref:DGQHR domain-containing protein DpdB n=1 Tax=Mesorhizobium sp. M1D.F.Ca.ET.043.01.1.1 TaxID=2493669 RepID=UPI000F762514|nr:DGQHR domain-containing protein DpdB [Mesorhizobium sp. M1D.F.Ca.ET.043.01.1.1]AZO73516.1 DGQHR domain-containing protein [Mesorhizobium sp. M1D.F.Ca.ET.043.01.1.1]
MSGTRLLHFDVVVPRQSEALPVFSFAAKASEVARFARIERAGRDEVGVLQGFQRPQIAGHIREIRDYLEKPSAILPNPIVVAFMGSASLEMLPSPSGSSEGKFGHLTIDVTGGAPGWIVDGQQRFTALSEMRDREFEVLVSGFICDSLEELQKQFILINNTRPLPKALVYELLPQVSDLPPRMSNRSQAALVIEALNYREGSALRGMIRQQTNPKGIIRDTVLQRVVMNSLTDGALRLYADDNHLLLGHGVDLVSEFFHAVRHVFADDWDGKSPKTSRLVHGAGIIAMGYVMEALHVMTGAEDRQAFARGLRHLKGRTAWSSGEWVFGHEHRRWNGLQNVPSDIRQLSMYLVQELKRALPKTVEAA